MTYRLQLNLFSRQRALLAALAWLVACGGKSGNDGVLPDGVGGASIAGTRADGASSSSTGGLAIYAGGTATGGQSPSTGGKSAGTSAGGAGGQPMVTGGTLATSTGGTSDGGSTSTGGSASTGGATSACATGFDMKYMTLLFEGTWLCGWSGGLDHYSWLRFRQSDLNFAVLNPSCLYCSSFLGCEGADGRVDFGAAVGAVILTLPSNCAEIAPLYWKVTEVCPNSGFPQEPDTVLRVTTLTSTTFDCFRYPIDYCAPDFSSCPSPW